MSDPAGRRALARAGCKPGAPDCGTRISAASPDRPRAGEVRNRDRGPHGADPDAISKKTKVQKKMDRAVRRANVNVQPARACLLGGSSGTGDQRAGIRRMAGMAQTCKECSRFQVLVAPSRQLRALSNATGCTRPAFPGGGWSLASTGSGRRAGWFSIVVATISVSMSMSVSVSMLRCRQVENKTRWRAWCVSDSMAGSIGCFLAQPGSSGSGSGKAQWVGAGKSSLAG